MNASRMIATKPSRSDLSTHARANLADLSQLSAQLGQGATACSARKALGLACEAFDHGDWLQAASELELMSSMLFALVDLFDELGLPGSVEAGDFEAGANQASDVARDLVRFGNRCANCGKLLGVCRFCGALSATCCMGPNDCYRACDRAVQVERLVEFQGLVDQVQLGAGDPDLWRALAARALTLAEAASA